MFWAEERKEPRLPNTLELYLAWQKLQRGNQRMNLKHVLVLLATVLACAVGALAQDKTSGQTPEIKFTVSMPQPFKHLFEVEVQIKRGGSGAAPADETLVMPVWTPGSYLIREYARHVQDFSAQDAAGNSLSWEKINKDSWHVFTNRAREWRATYRVYANELSVRTSELNADHAFWNNATLLMYLDGYLKSPSLLKVAPQAGWKIATGLPALPGDAQTFRAENFDVLYDSPVEVSDFKELSFEVRGVPHRIVIDGQGNYDPEMVRRDVKSIVEAEVELMGDIPYHDYTFILHLRANAGGGLEHLNSTALGYPRFGFRTSASDRSTSAAPFAAASEREYQGFLGLVAHEFFHLWNVKRIRPDALGPFDYTKENYTKLLWAAEGITDYYADIALRRAGLVSDKDYLASVSKAIQSLQETPGRLVQSAEEASFDSWIKYYRQDENSVNSQVSYYDKGALLGMLLDLEIRKRSAGGKSLDDVMRYHYNEFYKKGRNYTPQDFQKTCELMAGASLEQFFASFVRWREELNYNAALDAAGLRLDTSTDTFTRITAPDSLGASLAQEGDRLLVRNVIAGSAAYEQGLNAGDQIVAFDGARASLEFVLVRLAEKKPGDVVRLTIFRFDDLRALDIKLSARAAASYHIVSVANPSGQQKQIYQSWLGAPLGK
jgi:predicted metalloprotease with PDZ domain